MTVDIALIAVRIRMMETHTKRGSVGIAQLKAESAQNVPLRFRCQLIWQGHIHRPADRGVPPLLRPFSAGFELSRLHDWSDNLPLD